MTTPMIDLWALLKTSCCVVILIPDRFYLGDRNVGIDGVATKMTIKMVLKN
jgi:hypothetical protein